MCHCAAMSLPATNIDTDVLVVDHGPVRDAALILTTVSTLKDHVTVTDGDYTTTIEMDSSIPFELWGSGTQMLWYLLAAIAYSRYDVSLYKVAERLDDRNRVAAAAALVALLSVAQ
jgi:hypothetical protein